MSPSDNQASVFDDVNRNKKIRNNMKPVSHINNFQSPMELSIKILTLSLRINSIMRFAFLNKKFQ